MRILLAFDNDAAGYQAVVRTLEREIGNLDIPLTPAEMLPNAYRLWLRGLGVPALIVELDRLIAADNPEDIVKIRLLNDQLMFCQLALNHAKHRNKYIEAIQSYFKESIYGP